MKIRAHQHRGRRKGGRSLKLGKQTIRSMSEEQFDLELSRIPTGGSPAAWKEAGRIRRALKQLRKSESVEKPVIIRQGFRSSPVLDAIYPERKAKWLPSWRRHREDKVDLVNFSFLDDPLGTMLTLRKLAECEADCRTFSMNFEDKHCKDIAPYMVLGLIRQRMLPVCREGTIRHGINRVIGAVHLTDYLRISTRPVGGDSLILPFPLRERRGQGASTKDNSAWAVSSEERVDSKLVATIDQWLGALSPPRRLSPTGRVNILTLAGEILDNAKRHSDPSEDGTWAIAGFMESRRRDDGSMSHVCHIGIINPGLTIFETLQLAPEPLRERIASFSERHLPRWPASSRYDEEALWTLCSLQDGISRAKSDETPNGFGMLTFVEAANSLGKSSRPDEQPRMTIISGSACLTVRPPYNIPAKQPSGHRALALNASNSLQNPPDQDYVFSLPYRFPGTIVAVRFCIDADELVRTT
ncbi:hypothetical protein ACNJYD_04345 [Bradyrhizobium sp. DASA03005]|uniref:hypothetical protein n=1 Tax=Bradyrhizobium sp. SPXBL-02 TaxID=3395912 RepID=UPI003F70CA9A